MNEPLWMPKGSVRAILALMSVGGLIAAVFIGISGEHLAVLGSVAGAASTSYFNARNQQNAKA